MVVKQKRERASLRVPFKQNEKIVTLQEQIEKLQIENQQKITLERENNKLRNENTRIVEEYRAWRERLKTLIKKMGLF